MCFLAEGYPFGLGYLREPPANVLDALCLVSPPLILFQYYPTGADPQGPPSKPVPKPNKSLRGNNKNKKKTLDEALLFAEASLEHPTV